MKIDLFCYVHSVFSVCFLILKKIQTRNSLVDILSCSDSSENEFLLQSLVFLTVGLLD